MENVFLPKGKTKQNFYQFLTQMLVHMIFRRVLTLILAIIPDDEPCLMRPASRKRLLMPGLDR